MIKQEFNVMSITDIVNDRCDDKERQIKAERISEKCSSALYRGKNFSRGKRTSTECCNSNEII